MRRRRAVHGDRGAILILFALTLVIIFMMVAFAVDLGFGRSDRRTNRSYSDLAAIAAGYHLAGNADLNRFAPQADPVEACKAAIRSLQTNAPDFQPSSADFSPYADAEAACTAHFATCDPSNLPLIVPSGPWELTITHPVSDSSISDSNFGADGLTDEDGDDPCERMGIDLGHSRDTYFARVVGIPEVHTAGSAVVRGRLPDPNERVVPAFFMLDRTMCKAIWTNVGAGTAAPDPSLLYGDGILVRSTGSGPEEQAGFMHTDSNAAECNPSVTGDYAVFAREPGGYDTMVVEPSASGQDGVIESTATNGRSGAGGTNVPVSVGDVIGREPVDEVYQSAITQLHGIASAAVNDTGAPVSPDPTNNPVITYDCAGAPSTPPPASGPWIAYVNCADFGGPLTANASTVVFEGASVGNGQLVSFPNATNVTVRGLLQIDGTLHLPSAQNMYVGERFVVGSNGVVGLNAVYDAAVSPSSTNPRCNANGAGPVAGSTTRLVVFSPTGGAPKDEAFVSAGRLAMCATTVYLPGEKNDSSYDEKSVTSGAECSAEYPCPLVGANDIPGARYALSGDVNWFAPDTSTAALTAGMPLPPSGGIEDLALWGEGGGSTNQTEGSSVKGGGTLFTYSGVFFSPNSKVELQSGNANTGPVDAQFIARAVTILGGRFEMQPALQNTVPVPVRGSFQLIR